MIGEKEATEFFISFIEQFLGIKLKVDKSIIWAFEYEDGDILMLQKVLTSHESDDDDDSQFWDPIYCDPINSLENKSF